nr:hypothetical protein [Tanacetum cinerariifolium]
MKRGFLSQKGCEGGRGVKENDLNWNKKNTSLGIGVSTDSEDIMYDDFFLEKLVEYPVVANYVRNTWGKFRLVRSMFSATISLFSFHFSSMDGLDAMLENGDDGLSAIATKHGTPLMLDSYTSNMCMQSWGMSSYARVMIELRADVELTDNIVVAMPRIKGEGHYICNVRVEYEWKPPRCTSCKVFGHIHEEC